MRYINLSEYRLSLRERVVGVKKKERSSDEPGGCTTETLRKP